MRQVNLLWRGILLCLVLFAGSLAPFENNTVTANASQNASSANASAPTTIISPAVTDSPNSINPQSSNPAASIAIVSGNNQSIPLSATFPTSLKVQLKDSQGNPPVSSAVRFEAPASGPSAALNYYPSNVVTATSDSNGMASVYPIANCQPGSYTITASTSSVITPTTFVLTNTISTPANLVADYGSAQSTHVNTAFSIGLDAKAVDSNNQGINCLTVRFDAPTNPANPSATFVNGSNSITVTTNYYGTYYLNSLTANNVAGTFTVTATLPDYPAIPPAYYHLTNFSDPATISVTNGDNQASVISSDFANPFKVLVEDSVGTPLRNITVNFQSPSGGASGTFSGGQSAAVKTDTNGIAQAPVFTANCVAGTYSVTATVPNLNTYASFNLTNTQILTVKSTENQRALVNSAFADNFKATVTNNCNNLVPDVPVTFQAPSSGVSGAFNDTNTYSTTVNSGPDGIAVAPPFIANNITGTYAMQVNLNTENPVATANFTLTNLPADYGDFLPKAYQIDPAHTGAITMSNVVVPHLQQKWLANLNGRAFGPPIIAQNKVYIALNALNGNCSDSIQLYALDVQSGAVVWHTTTGTAWDACGLSGIAYDNGKIFLTNGGELHTFDADTGIKLWVVNSLVPLGQHTIGGIPVAYNGIVYITGYGSGADVMAFSETDGRFIWKNPIGYDANSIPAVDETGVYNLSGGIYSAAYEPLNGTLLWAHYYAGSGFTSVLYQNKLYATVNGIVYSSLTGDPVYSGLNLAGAPPAFSKNIGVFLNAGNVEARNTNDLSVLWSVTLPGGQPLSAPIIINDYVYVVSNSGKIYGLNIHNGSVLWTYQLANNVLNSMNTIDAGQGLLVVPTDNGVEAFQSAPSGVGYFSDPNPGSTINIGTVDVGFTITNTLFSFTDDGNAPLVVNSATITGSQANNFQIITPTNFPITIPVGGPGQPLTVQCAPSVSGLITATLLLTTNDPAQPQVSYTLNCTGALTVINPNDNGLGDTPGSFSYLLTKATNGQTIDFQLVPVTDTVIITNSSATPKTLLVPTGVTVNGGCAANGPTITLNGVGTTSNNLPILIFGGQNTLSGLKIEGFKGAPVTFQSPGNHLQCVKITRVP